MATLVATQLQELRTRKVAAPSARHQSFMRQLLDDQPKAARVALSLFYEKGFSPELAADRAGIPIEEFLSIRRKVRADYFRLTEGTSLCA